MTKEELIDMDLDIVNIMRKMPDEDGYAYCFFGCTPEKVSGSSIGDVQSLKGSMYSAMIREDGLFIREAIIDAALNYMVNNFSKEELKRARNVLKK